MNLARNRSFKQTVITVCVCALVLALAALAEAQESEGASNTSATAAPKETPTPSTTKLNPDRMLPDTILPDTILMVPSSLDNSLLADCGISFPLSSSPVLSSQLIKQLDEIDREIRELEQVHAPGLDRGVIGGDSRKVDSKESVVKRQAPPLKAILASPSLLGVQLPVADPAFKPANLKPARDPEVFCDVECSVGASLAALGLYEDGETLLLRAYRNVRSAEGRDDARTQQVLRNLVQLYESWSATTPAKKRAAQHYRSLLAR